MQDLDVAAIRARCEAATPGPWNWNDINNPRPGIYGSVKDSSGQHLMGAIDVENAEFIAHARTDVPALLSALGVADEELTRSRQETAGLRARAQEAEAALERVKALHPRHECNYTGDEATCPDGDECEWIYCAGCWERYPCPTIAALHGVPSQPQGDPT